MPFPGLMTSFLSRSFRISSVDISLGDPSIWGWPPIAPPTEAKKINKTLIQVRLAKNQKPKKFLQNSKNREVKYLYN